MDIYFEIERLLNFGLKKNLIEVEDLDYFRNIYFDMFDIEPKGNEETIEENLNTATPILNNIFKYFVNVKVLNDDNTTYDLFTTKVMGVITPKPSEVNKIFFDKYNVNKDDGTKYLYDLSRNCNYIMVDRVSKNIEWDCDLKYGKYHITINVSKPEKTIEEIKAASVAKDISYPKCLLCKESVGFKGNYSRPARQNLRIIPLDFGNDKWYLQFSPYVYFNEHSILFSAKHVPMAINNETFLNICNALDALPHYFVGSNADLPIVGGSILSHNHFQSGNYNMPLFNAKDKYVFENDNFKDVKLSIVDWGMSVIKVESENKESVLNVSAIVLDKWKKYSAEHIDIFSHTGDVPHNTITPIGKKNNEKYVMYLVLRNNRTSNEHPNGIFHPHKEKHHIKRENIGLIEVMGLGVLPKRLESETKELEKYLIDEKADIKDIEDSYHYDWVKYLIDKYGTNNKTDDVATIFKNEIGLKFEQCLIDCGVFKDNEVGNKEFLNFVKSLNWKN